MSDPQNNDTTPQAPAGVTRRTLIKAAGLGVAGAAVAWGMDKAGLLPGASSPRPAPPTDKMTYRANPANGDKISLLAFGCMRLPMQPGALSPTGAEIDEAAAIALVDYAMAHGVNYYDTAWGYHQGQSQTVIGKALKRYPRESFYLANKMPGYLLPTLDKAKEIFEEQLRRCQVEYFDYYMLHSIMSVKAYRTVYEENGVLDYLLEQKHKGRLRNLGWSFHGDKETLEYLLRPEVPHDFALVQLNYHDLYHKLEARRFVQANVPVPAPTDWMYEQMVASGIPIMVMEPLLGGRLARLNKKSLAVLQEERPQDSAAAWAMRHVGGLPNVLTVLSGMTYLEHVQDNIRSYAPHVPLSPREEAVLKASLDIFLKADNIPCTTCGYCMPCPYGVDIPGIFAHHNRCLDDEQLPKDAMSPDYAKARRAYLVSHERSVAELRRPARCTGCNKCTPNCPQFIDIPKQMAQLGKFVEELRTRG